MDNKTGNRQPPSGGPTKCEWAYKPNMMKFFDENGAEYKIHMPTGTYEKATQHYINEEWDELKKFPKWGELT